MKNLRASVIRLAFENPSLRGELLPLLLEKTAEAEPRYWTDGDPKAPRTPWGPAQTSYEIERGVRFFSTASHGGFGISRDAARRFLSPAALKEAEVWQGAYWFEEDVASSVPLYEHPEWGPKAGFSSSESAREERIRRNFPKYLEEKESGQTHAPKLVRGMSLRVLKRIKFSNGEVIAPGTNLVVDSLQGTNFLFIFEGMKYKLPLAYYYANDPFVTAA